MCSYSNQEMQCATGELEPKGLLTGAPTPADVACGRNVSGIRGWKQLQLARWQGIEQLGAVLCRGAAQPGFHRASAAVRGAEGHPQGLLGLAQAQLQPLPASRPAAQCAAHHRHHGELAGGRVLAGSSCRDARPLEREDQQAASSADAECCCCCRCCLQARNRLVAVKAAKAKAAMEAADSASGMGDDCEQLARHSTDEGRRAAVEMLEGMQTLEQLDMTTVEALLGKADSPGPHPGQATSARLRPGSKRHVGLDGTQCWDGAV